MLESQKQSKSQILFQQLHKKSDFEQNFFRPVRFRNEISKTCQILNRKKFIMRQILNSNYYNGLDFWFEKFSTCQILKSCLHSKYHVLALFTQWKPNILHFLWFVEKQDFESKILQHVWL